MTRTTDQTILEQAIAWHLRLQPGDAADWDQFVEWLEADPERSDAYEMVEASHAALTPDTFPAAAPQGARQIARRRGWIGGAAVAAALVLALVFSLRALTGPDLYAVTTGPGQQRVIALADGGSVTLNGGTRVMLDRKNSRFAELTQGEASFRVVHDPDNPFTVVANGNRLRDAGTVFNVVSERGGFGVEVAEGSVVFDPDSKAIALTAGQTLRKSATGEPVLGRIDPLAVGGWQRGQLSYTNAPLARVVADLSRTQGALIRAAPEVADLPFTGSLRIGADPGTTASDLAASAGLSARKTADGWIIGR